MMHDGMLTKLLVFFGERRGELCFFKQKHDILNISQKTVGSCVFLDFQIILISAENACLAAANCRGVGLQPSGNFSCNHVWLGPTPSTRRPRQRPTHCLTTYPCKQYTYHSRTTPAYFFVCTLGQVTSLCNDLQFRARKNSISRAMLPSMPSQSHLLDAAHFPQHPALLHLRRGPQVVPQHANLHNSLPARGPLTMYPHIVDVCLIARGKGTTKVLLYSSRSLIRFQRQFI